MTQNISSSWRKTIVRTKKNNSIIKSRSDENVLKCKMNNDLYDLDKKVNNLRMNSNNLNSSNDYSVNKTTRIIDDTINGGDDEYQTPIKVHNSETRTSSYSTSHHGNSQQYQNSHNVEISLDRDYVSSRGCPQKKL